MSDYVFSFQPLLVCIRNHQLLNVSLTGVWTKSIRINIETNTKLIGVRFILIAAEYIFTDLGIY
jgi:hypothetical protein